MTTRTYLVPTHGRTGEQATRIEVTGKTEREVEKITLGLLRCMSEGWIVDEVEETEDPEDLTPDHDAQPSAIVARAVVENHNLRALLLRIADGGTGSETGSGCPGRKLYASAERMGLTFVEMPVLTPLGKRVAEILQPSSDDELAEAKRYKVKQ